MNFIMLSSGVRNKNNVAAFEYSKDRKKLTVDEPWFLIKNKLARFLCHAHLASNVNDKLPLPFRSVWNKALFGNRFEEDEPVCLIVSSHFFALEGAGVIKYLKKKHPDSKVVFKFSDRYDYFKSHYKTFPSLEHLFNTYDMVISYNVHDVEKYGFVQNRLILSDYSDIVNDESIPESDLLFVGQHKGRLELLLDIYEKATAAGLRCDFHITNLPEDEMKYSDVISYNTPIPYDEVLKRVKRTKCIINLTQEGGGGVTKRDYEAVGNDKLLLTNNKMLETTDLYHDDQIIWLEDLESRIEDIRQGFSGHRDYLGKYSQDKWYEWLEGELTK